MEKMTIGEIEQKLLIERSRDDAFIQFLKKDERKGVQKVLAKWEKLCAKEELLQKKFVEMTSFEREIRKQGFQLIAGIDEAGRGPLAGPVVAAAVILPEEFYLPGIDDSKKLSEQSREEYFAYIQSEAIAVGVGIIDAQEIDSINILEAAKKAMLNAVSELTVSPDYLLVDAVKLETPYPAEALIKGDARSVTIAAASIIAKVTRDRLMKEIDKEYPHYGFASNMGYGTAVHLDALRNYGVTPYHRKSFSPVKEYDRTIVE
ncbi:ribonuclease HII [Mesobacillus maritimus]|uniref:ribonuclease HII n=1 Tax=Mesobacillus maritimus TaxID=1643336 RepID=UPI00203D4A8F|nr:ribonuclease HII [Mesobacillus maritimus]MCM3587167.1 ribonuclease HII [Mesobacillus maritimus]MCM3667732.1 ribonuclease HII [Mesobacillus maritimus]